jgi:diguanylate cyclase (GGDEF)-like protein
LTPSRIFRRPARPSPRISYLIALSVVALLSIGAYGVLSNLIRAQDGSAVVINLSGRQRMLSQRIAMEALWLVTAPAEQRAQRRAALQADLSALNSNHAALLSGDRALGLPGPPSPAIQALYDQPPAPLNARLAAYTELVQTVLDTPDNKLRSSLSTVQDLLDTASGELLVKLDVLVTAYQTEAEAKVARLRRLESAVLIVTLLTLLLEAALIFLPLERELRRRSNQLVHDAMHDALTSLPNRALFMTQLAQAIARRQRDPAALFAVLFLDCDRFKVINDSLGHSVGDALLIALATRLQSCVRGADTVARLGGDEFTLLLHGIKDLQDAVVVAERIGRSLLAPLDVGGQMLYVTVSIGLISSEEAYERPEDVLRDADLAMYRAKALGRGRYELFSPALRERAAALMNLEHDLRGAEARGELSVHYQPVVALPGAVITGFEALLRWTHPQHGPISPGEFIPLAEETGLIALLDRFVLRTACAQMRAWQAEFAWAPPLTLSVNLSARHLQQRDLSEFVARTLAESRFPAHLLHLELTETVLTEDSQDVRLALAALRALGTELHIDDFGTGYSNLAYLHRFSASAIIGIRTEFR